MRVALVWLLAWSLPLLAAEPVLKPGDFAFGMTLQGESGSPFYAVELPEELYRHVTRGDLGDVRVFNAEGEVVPHLLQQPTASAQQQRVATLPFFPLFDEPGTAGSETTLRIVPDAKGALIDLRARSGGTGSQRISHYLIDASGMQVPAQRLRLQWQGAASFIGAVVLEGSDDLHHWRYLTSASLAQLFYGADRLQRNEIPLSAVKMKYLRLSWPWADKQVTLSSVSAIQALPGAQAPLIWSPATALRSDPANEGYRFEMPGFYPLERLEVVLPQANSVVRVSLASADSAAPQHWQLRYQGTVYSLQQEGEQFDSGPFSIPPTSQRYWRLDVIRHDGGLGGGQPQLRLGWRAQHLLFVARGGAPFTLAFGSARVAPAMADGSLQGVLEALRTGQQDERLVKQALPQPLHILGGETRLRPVPAPLPWKRWLLWGVLLLGVALMVAMARSLYRQMSRA